MRFKKGSEVEVFHSSKLHPAGASWRPAEILCGNGRTYSVRYNYCCCKSGEEERVPRKALRPPPPPVKKKQKKADKWVPHDPVEVFVHGFWKPGKVTGVAYGNEFYFVSLIGRSREVAVKKSNLRKRCAWENGKWVTIKKESGKQMGNNSCENESTVSSTGSCNPNCKDDAVSSFVPVQVAERTGIKSEAHELELDAYHSTMVALYANGFISWEQETMLSNLRLLLNISFDEHQSVLRSLAPSR